MKKFTFDNFSNKSKILLSIIQNNLIDQLNSKQLSFALSQVLLETGNFSKSSTVYKENNNFSGIKWINKPYQKNAIKGSLSPEGNYYAKFNTPEDWANDYIRILSLKRSKNTIGRPIDAENIEDFNNRLYANSYYSTLPGAKESYLKNLQFWLKKLGS
mgnify:FL=1